MGTCDELIETLWNVNADDLTDPAPATTELIETLWNVNYGRPYFRRKECFRINRNIVECKLEKIVNESSGGLMN